MSCYHRTHMKKLALLSLVLMCLSAPSHAEDETPLRVGVVSFTPPFVMQSADKSFHGFDISTMRHVCAHLNRKCTYIPMALDEVMMAVESGRVDMGIGGIIITLERARQVRFSTPYLPSDAQFFTLTKTPIKSPFHADQLTRKTIGVVNGSSYERTVRLMDIKKPRLITFDTVHELLDALRANSIKFALLSRPKVTYWISNSSGMLKTAGEPFAIGFGFAIAINPNNRSLIHEVNAAVEAYHKSDAFIHNYHTYIKNEF